MPVFETRIVVPHSSENMFELVSDVTRYPEFIRWIKTLDVADSGEPNRRICNVAVGFRGFTERFSTYVTTDSDARSIQADLIRGPFHRLKNVWTISDAPNGQTGIEFYIDYEFSNFLLRILAKNNFQLAVDKIMHAFLTEADRRYTRTA